MKLSTDQVKRFWREWPKSCKAMGWTKANGLSADEIDAKRKELIARCGFKSLTEVDRVAGFTKVLNELLVLQGTSLKAAREADDPSINEGRVLRTLILTELVPCLELYIADVRAYIQRIMEDKNRYWKIDRPACEMSIMDLDTKPVPSVDRSTGELKEFPSPLKQMMFTLQARLNELRNQSGDTIHDMKIKAGVKCTCAICRKPGVTLVNHLADLPAAEAEQLKELVKDIPF
jgi:hypothetical protein